MAPTTETEPATEPQAQPKVVELTINAKPTTANEAEEKEPEKEPEPEPTTKEKPEKAERPRKLPRSDTKDFNDLIDYTDSECDNDRTRRLPPPRRRHRDFSPVRIIPPAIDPPLITSSTNLLEKLNNFDGIAEAPFPARGGVYLSTYPFSNKDVQRWSWILGSGVEETYMSEPKKSNAKQDDDDDEEEDEWYQPRGRGVRPHPYINRHRNRSPGFDPMGNEVSSVFLSRALDTKVVPEDGKVKFVIVAQNKSKNASSAGAVRLLVSESRKAAGMLIFYELLNGASINFVGAVPAEAKLVREKKKKVQFKRTETLDEAVKLYEDEGIVGVVC